MTDRHLRAVMFTDVVGYTALMQTDEGAAEAARASHRSLIESAVSEFGGELLEYFGDGSLSIFPSAVMALSAAIEIQSAAQGRSDLPLRIGIHEGEITFDVQGAYGDSVNIAARIQSLGSPGSVLISGKVHDDIKNQPSFTTVFLGEFELKNVARPMEIYAVDAPGLAVPTAEEISLERAGGDAGADRRLRGMVGIGPFEVPRRSVGPLLVLGVALVALGTLLTRDRGPEEARPVSRFDLTPPSGLGLLPNVGGVDLTISPDGQHIVYVGGAPGGSQLWSRSLEELGPSPIPGTFEGRDPVFSPGGESLAFRVGGSLRVVPLDGGPAITLVQRGLTGPGSWGDDGYIYYSSGADIHRVPASGGTPEAVTAAGGAEHRYPQLLPGGEHLLLTVIEQAPDSVSRIAVAPLAGGELIELLDGAMARYADPGFLVYSVSDGTLMAIGFDPESLQLRGSETVMLQGVDTRNTPTSKFAVSRSGSLVYRTRIEAGDEMEFLLVTGEGRADRVDPGWTFDPGPENRSWDLSPDGRRIALAQLTDVGKDIWIKEVDGTGMSRLSFGEREERMPRWAPDGQSVYFLSEELGDMDVWSKGVDGTAPEELVLDQDERLADVSPSPDGRWLLVRTAGTPGIVGERDILAYELGVDSIARPVLATPADESAPTLSPDSRWLAYHTDQTGRREVFIRPFPDVQAGQWQVSTLGGRSPVWSHDGSELYFIGNIPPEEGGGRRLMMARVDPGPPFSVAPPEVLFAIDDNYYFANNTTSYSLTPDGDRFLMARYPGEELRVQMVLVVNFAEELVERVGR